MKKLLNPRGYLSHTQIELWLKSPQTYINQYILGQDKQIESAAMAYGKKTSLALENGVETGDTLLDTVVAILPAYSEREASLRATMPTQKGSVDLLGVLDTYDPKAPRFREYKTGRVPWTQGRADKHRQLPHYAAIIYLLTKKLPTEVWLDWAQTEWVDGDVRFTGNIKSFNVKLGLGEIFEYMALASRVAREIDAEYRKQLKELA